MRAKTIIDLGPKRADSVYVAEAFEVVNAAWNRGGLIRVTKLVDGQPRNWVLDSNEITGISDA